MNVPIPTLHLFPKLDEKLLELLRSLKPEDWSKPTLAKLWNVKDVTAHLLDGNIRGISMVSENHIEESTNEINSYQDLVDFLNRLNADWVTAMKRVSPKVLIELLEVTGKAYHQALTTLEPFRPAKFAVAWAGQQESPNWFHIAREYTEKWHHQQQIREAVGKPGIMTSEFYFPLIDTFMQALPHAYRNLPAPDGTTLKVEVTSLGGVWYLHRKENNWKLGNPVAEPDAEITTDPDTAWKLFTKGISASQAEKNIQFTGNRTLGNPILSMLAVMA